jgi:tRNA threonylcarbamoyladenosine biosynthesis protein TsaB
MRRGRTWVEVRAGEPLAEYNIEPIGFPVVVLALDTTTRAGSLAIVRDGLIVHERDGDPSRTHGERLPDDIARLLADAGLDLQAIDLLAVAAGPGSFTGLRVGIAAVQGLAMALDLRVVPVSSLEALARAWTTTHALIAPWMDAQRGEVFAALYDAAGRTVIVPPTSLVPDATLRRLEEAGVQWPIQFIGDGAVRYAELIAAHETLSTTVVHTIPRLAGVIGQIAWDAPHRAVSPHAVAPIYVRRPDAELARDRRHGSS